MQDVSATPTTLSTPVLKKAIGRYYKELEDYTGKAQHELALRSAFQNSRIAWAIVRRWNG